MKKEVFNKEEYKKWLIDLKSSIKQSQLKAALAVNSQLIMLYWNMGSEIAEKQEKAKWGSGFIEQLSKDLKAEFPEMAGFSVSNIYEIVKFYKYFCRGVEVFNQQGVKIEPENPSAAILQQAVGEFRAYKSPTSCWRIWENLSFAAGITYSGTINTTI